MTTGGPVDVAEGVVGRARAQRHQRDRAARAEDAEHRRQQGGGQQGARPADHEHEPSAPPRITALLAAALIHGTRPGRAAVQSAYRGAMTNEPPFGFGFGPADRDPDRDREPEPGSAALRLRRGFPGPARAACPGCRRGGFDMSQLGQMLTQLGQMLSQAQNTGGGPVNYDLAARASPSSASAGTSSSLTGRAARGRARRRAARGAVAGPGHRRSRRGRPTVAAWSASEWVTTSLPTWQRLCDPVAQRVSAAWVEALPEEVRAGAGPMLAMLGQMGGLAFGSQLGGGARAARRGGADLHGRRRARGPGRHRRAAAGEHREVHRGPRPARQRGA